MSSSSSSSSERSDSEEAEEREMRRTGDGEKKRTNEEDGDGGCGSAVRLIRRHGSEMELGRDKASEAEGDTEEESRMRMETMKISDLDVREAVKKLTQSANQLQKEQRPMTKTDSKDSCHRFYNWNTTHFYPDVHKLDIGILFRHGSDRTNRFGFERSDNRAPIVDDDERRRRSTAASGGDADYPDDEKEAKKRDSRKKKGMTLTRKSSSFENGGGMRDENGLGVKIDIDLDSESDDDDDDGDALKTWHKSPLRVRRLRRHDGRPLSAEINYDAVSKKLYIHTLSKRPATEEMTSAARRGGPDAEKLSRRLSAPNVAQEQQQQQQQHRPTMTRRKPDDRASGEPAQNGLTSTGDFRNERSLPQRFGSGVNAFDARKRRDFIKERGWSQGLDLYGEPSWEKTDSGYGYERNQLARGTLCSRSQEDMHYAEPARSSERQVRGRVNDDWQGQGQRNDWLVRDWKDDDQKTKSVKDNDGNRLQTNRKQNPSDYTNQPSSSARNQSKFRYDQNQTKYQNDSSNVGKQTTTYSVPRFAGRDQRGVVSSSFENIYDSVDLQPDVPDLNKVESRERKTTRNGFSESSFASDVLPRSAFRDVSKGAATTPKRNGNEAKPNQTKHDDFPSSAIRTGKPEISKDVFSASKRNQIDAKTLIEEEKQKFEDYKLEYRRQHSGPESSVSGPSGDDDEKDAPKGRSSDDDRKKKPMIPTDDYVYILRKIHHKRQDALCTEPTVSGSAKAAAKTTPHDRPSESVALLPPSRSFPAAASEFVLTKSESSAFSSVPSTNSLHATTQNVRPKAIQLPSEVYLNRLGYNDDPSFSPRKPDRAGARESAPVDPGKNGRSGDADANPEVAASAFQRVQRRPESNVKTVAPPGKETRRHSCRPDLIPSPCSTAANASPNEFPTDTSQNKQYASYRYKDQEPRVPVCASEPKVPLHGQEPKVPSHGQEPKVPLYGQEPKVMPSYVHVQHHKVPSYTHERQVLPSYVQESKVPSYAQDPKVPSYAQVPNVPSYAQDPKVPSYTHDPKVPSYAHDPKVPSYAHDPKVPSYAHDPKVPSYAHDPKVPSYAHDPKVTSYAQDPKLPSYAHDSKVPSYAHDPKVPPFVVNPCEVSWLSRNQSGVPQKPPKPRNVDHSTSKGPKQWFYNTTYEPNTPPSADEKGGPPSLLLLLPQTSRTDDGSGHAARERRVPSLEDVGGFLPPPPPPSSPPLPSPPLPSADTDAFRNFTERYRRPSIEDERNRDDKSRGNDRYDKTMVFSLTGYHKPTSGGDKTSEDSPFRYGAVVRPGGGKADEECRGRSYVAAFSSSENPPPPRGVALDSDSLRQMQWTNAEKRRPMFWRDDDKRRPIVDWPDVDAAEAEEETRMRERARMPEDAMNFDRLKNGRDDYRDRSDDGRFLDTGRNYEPWDLSGVRPPSGPSDRDAPRDVLRDVPRDALQDILRDVPRDVLRDIPSYVSRDISRDVPRDMSREAPRNTSQSSHTFYTVNMPSYAMPSLDPMSSRIVVDNTVTSPPPRPSSRVPQYNNQDSIGFNPPTSYFHQPTLNVASVQPNDHQAPHRPTLDATVVRPNNYQPPPQKPLDHDRPTLLGSLKWKSLDEWTQKSGNEAEDRRRDGYGCRRVHEGHEVVATTPEEEKTKERTNQSRATHEYEKHVTKSQESYKATKMAKIEAEIGDGDVSTRLATTSKESSSVPSREFKLNLPKQKSALELHLSSNFSPLTPPGSKTPSREPQHPMHRGEPYNIAVDITPPNYAERTPVFGMSVSTSGSKERLVQADDDDVPQVNVAAIKAKLFGPDEYDAARLFLGRQIPIHVERRTQKNDAQNVKTGGQHSASNDPVKSSARTEEKDEERLFDYVSYKDGVRKKRSQIYDQLTDFERTYEGLDINDDNDVEGNVVIKNYPRPPAPVSSSAGASASDEPNVKRLSITNLKILTELHDRQTAYPSLEYTKEWLQSGKGGPDALGYDSPSAAPAVRSGQEQPTSSFALAADRANQSMTSSLPSESGRPPQSSANFPRKVIDDMAYRRYYCKASSSAACTKSTPDLPVQASCDQIYGMSSTPPVVVVEVPKNVATSTASRVSLNLNQISSNEKGYRPRPLSSYENVSVALKVQNADSNNSFPQTIRDRDVITVVGEDRSIGKLEKSATSFVIPVHRSISQNDGRGRNANGEATAAVTRIHVRKLNRSCSFEGGSSPSRPAAERKPETASKQQTATSSSGVAKIVELFEKSQSAPDLTEQTVFGESYTDAGELVSDDPRYAKHAARTPGRQKTLKDVKTRSENRSKPKMNVDSGYIENESDSQSSSGAELLSRPIQTGATTYSDRKSDGREPNLRTKLHGTSGTAYRVEDLKRRPISDYNSSGYGDVPLLVSEGGGVDETTKFEMAEERTRRLQKLREDWFQGKEEEENSDEIRSKSTKTATFESTRKPFAAVATTSVARASSLRQEQSERDERVDFFPPGAPASRKPLVFESSNNSLGTSVGANFRDSSERRNENFSIVRRNEERQASSDRVRFNVSSGEGQGLFQRSVVTNKPSFVVNAVQADQPEVQKSTLNFNLTTTSSSSNQDTFEIPVLKTSTGRGNADVPRSDIRPCLAATHFREPSQTSTGRGNVDVPRSDIRPCHATTHFREPSRPAVKYEIASHSDDVSSGDFKYETHDESSRFETGSKPSVFARRDDRLFQQNSDTQKTVIESKTAKTKFEPSNFEACKRYERIVDQPQRKSFEYESQEFQHKAETTTDVDVRIRKEQTQTKAERVYTVERKLPESPSSSTKLHAGSADDGEGGDSRIETRAEKTHSYVERLEFSDGEMTDATDVTLDAMVGVNQARPSSAETLDFSDAEMIFTSAGFSSAAGENRQQQSLLTQFEAARRRDDEAAAAAANRAVVSMSKGHHHQLQGDVNAAKQEKREPPGMAASSFFPLQGIAAASQQQTTEELIAKVQAEMKLYKKDRESKAAGGGTGGGDPTLERRRSIKELVNSFEGMASPFMRARQRTSEIQADDLAGAVAAAAVGPAATDNSQVQNTKS